jgi:response regulator NasT
LKTRIDNRQAGEYNCGGRWHDAGGKDGAVLDRALAVSSGERSIEMLTEMLMQASVLKVTAAGSGKEARCAAIDGAETDFELCVINTPLNDEFGDALARDIVAKCASEVILLVKSESYDAISAEAGEYGIITVAKPINKALFWNAVKMSQTAHKRLQIIRRENERLQQKIEDIRVIDRAKCTLIAYLSMSEPEAHKYIERQAMDARVTKRAVAEDILKTYES